MKFVFILATFAFVAVNCNNSRRISHHPKDTKKGGAKDDKQSQLIRDITSQLAKQMPKPVNVQLFNSLVNFQACCNETRKGNDTLSDLVPKGNGPDFKFPNNTRPTHKPKHKKTTRQPRTKPVRTTTPKPVPTTTAPPIKAPPLKCKEPDSKFDICLLLDESGSVGKTNYEKEKTFLANFVDEFDVGANKTRFCLIEFSNRATIRLHLDDTVSKKQVEKAIMSQYYRGSTTNIYAALQDGHKEIKANKRPGVPQLIVLLTDGVHNMNGDPVEAATDAKDDGINIFSVGVTNHVNKKQLEEIAGSKDRLMLASDFDQLVKSVNKMIKSICSETA